MNTELTERRIEQPLQQQIEQLQADIAWHEDQDLKHRERIAELELEQTK